MSPVKLFFPDNTVLINFALIKRIDLLERLIDGQGAWSASVASECAQSATYPGQEALHKVPAIFGEPIAPNRAELQQTVIFRYELSSPGDGSHKHVGEAETVAIIQRRFPDSRFITDDKDAARLAARHGIVTFTTWDLLRLAVRVNFISPDLLWGYINDLRGQKRGSPPGVRDLDSFDQWLAQ